MFYCLLPAQEFLERKVITFLSSQHEFEQKIKILSECCNYVVNFFENFIISRYRLYVLNHHP